MRVKYGAGRISHPMEWKQRLQEMKRAGVEIEFQVGRLGYEPQPSGQYQKPGKLVIDPDASISALRHEYSHFVDDRNTGYQGIPYFFSDYDRMWGGEFRAYLEELKFVRERKDFELARELVKLMRERRREIRVDWFGMDE